MSSITNHPGAASPELQAMRRDVQTVQYQLNELRSLLIPTGFVQVGPPIVVFCNVTRGNGDGWYVIENGQPRTMWREFWGYVDWFRIFETDGRARDSWKFRLHMRDRPGQTYEFEAGLDSFPARSMIAMLAQAHPEQLRQVMKLESYTRQVKRKGKATQDQTLAIKHYDFMGNRIDAPWRSDQDWRATVKEADHNMLTALGKTRSGSLSDYEKRSPE